MPIHNPTVHRQILNEVLMQNMLDVANSWDLMALVGGGCLCFALPLHSTAHLPQPPPPPPTHTHTPPLSSHHALNRDGEYQRSRMPEGEVGPPHNAHEYFRTHESLSGKGGGVHIPTKPHRQREQDL